MKKKSDQFSAADVMATALFIEIFNDVEVGWVRENLEKFVEFAYAINFEGGDCFDHHQKGEGNGKRENGVPYSSAGIFWRYIGREIIGDDDPNVEMIWSIIDEDLITNIDAHDNGMRVSYLSCAISAFNPTCQEKYLSSDECFKNAVSVVRQIFQRKLEHARAKALDTSKIKKVFEASPRGEN